MINMYVHVCAQRTHACTHARTCARKTPKKGSDKKKWGKNTGKSTSELPKSTCNAQVRWPLGHRAGHLHVDWVAMLVKLGEMIGEIKVIIG